MAARHVETHSGISACNGAARRGSPARRDHGPRGLDMESNYHNMQSMNTFLTTDSAIRSDSVISIPQSRPMWGPTRASSPVQAARLAADLGHGRALAGRSAKIISLFQIDRAGLGTAPAATTWPKCGHAAATVRPARGRCAAGWRPGSGPCAATARPFGGHAKTPPHCPPLPSMASRRGVA